MPSGRCTCTPPWPTSPPILGDAALKRACEVLWKDVTSKRMYVTAGLGPSASNEGFTEDYDLQNDTAYAETCASVALIFWAQRMLNLDCDGEYADVHGAGAVQRRALRPLARRHALFLREPARERAATTRAGNGTPAHAAR